MHWMEVTGQCHTARERALHTLWRGRLVGRSSGPDVLKKRIQTLDIQVCTLVTILTMPSWLQ